MQRTVGAVADGASLADAFSVEELAMSRILENCLQAMSRGKACSERLVLRHDVDAQAAGHLNPSLT